MVFHVICLCYLLVYLNVAKVVRCQLGYFISEQVSLSPHLRKLVYYKHSSYSSLQTTRYVNIMSTIFTLQSVWFTNWSSLIQENEDVMVLATKRKASDQVLIVCFKRQLTGIIRSVMCEKSFALKWINYLKSLVLLLIQEYTTVVHI